MVGPGSQNRGFKEVPTAYSTAPQESVSQAFNQKVAFADNPEDEQVGLFQASSVRGRDVGFIGDKLEREWDDFSWEFDPQAAEDEDQDDKHPAEGD